MDLWGRFYGLTNIQEWTAKAEMTEVGVVIQKFLSLENSWLDPCPTASLLASKWIEVFLNSFWFAPQLLLKLTRQVHSAMFGSCL